MSQRILSVSCCLLTLAWLCPLSTGALLADDETLNDLSLEVLALQTLYQLQATPAQLGALRQMCRKTVDRASSRQAARENTKLRRTLIELRAALLKGTDANLIVDLSDRLEALRTTEKPQVDETFDITDAARAEAPQVLRLLTVSQTAAYVGSYADDLADPYERIREALAAVRDLDEASWKRFRADIADEVGRLLAGLDLDRGGELGDRVVQLLIVARVLNADEFAVQRPDLERKARAIVADVGPTDVLRHVLEFHLAELLSNPRLPAVLESRLK